MTTQTTLLTPPIGSYKAKKGLSKDVANFMMYLTPHKSTIDGKEYNLCPMASKGCALACLNTAGRGAFQNVINARLNRTKFYIRDRKAFLKQLDIEIAKGINWAKNKGLKPVFRLNGTSDLPFEKTGIMDKYLDIQFYDYTKIKEKLFNNTKSNYQVTFSLSEDNEKEAIQVLDKGFNVAVVFENKLPETYVLRDKRGRFINGYKSYKVINGDLTDLRYEDPQTGVIVGLVSKGKAKKDSSGFVKRVNS